MFKETIQFIGIIFLVAAICIAIGKFFTDSKANDNQELLECYRAKENLILQLSFCNTDLATERRNCASGQWIKR